MMPPWRPGAIGAIRRLYERQRRGRIQARAIGPGGAARNV